MVPLGTSMSTLAGGGPIGQLEKEFVSRDWRTYQMTKKPHAADAKPTKKTHKAKTGAARPAAEAAVAGSAAQPLFADIQNLLDTLVPPSDANIDSAPHQRFWRKAPTNTRGAMHEFR